LRLMKNWSRFPWAMIRQWFQSSLRMSRWVKKAGMRQAVAEQGGPPGPSWRGFTPRGRRGSGGAGEQV
jgi:hypothetical protein